MAKKNKGKPKGQRIPSFKEEEIDFLIEREFSDRAQAAKNKFSGLHTFAISTTRTQAAILKLADGDLDQLRGLIKEANTDPRDVIAYAEYPRSSKLGWSESGKLSETARQAMNDADWEEYQAWRRKGNTGDS